MDGLPLDLLFGGILDLFHLLPSLELLMDSVIRCWALLGLPFSDPTGWSPLGEVTAYVGSPGLLAIT